MTALTNVPYRDRIVVVYYVTVGGSIWGAPEGFLSGLFVETFFCSSEFGRFDTRVSSLFFSFLQEGFAGCEPVQPAQPSDDYQDHHACAANLDPF